MGYFKEESMRKYFKNGSSANVTDDCPDETISALEALTNKVIKNGYHAKGGRFKLKMPYYVNIGKWCLSFYAMNMDWKSLRIKTTKENTIKRVIKKGIY